MGLGQPEITLLTQQRQILMLGEVNSQMQEMVCTTLLLLNAQSEALITLCFDSGGGSLLLAMYIYDAIKHSKAPVHGLVTVTAQSAAFDVLQACTRRLAYPNATLMTHSVEIRVRVNRPDFDEHVRKMREQEKSLFEQP